MLALDRAQLLQGVGGESRVADVERVAGHGERPAEHLELAVGRPPDPGERVERYDQGQDGQAGEPTDQSVDDPAGVDAAGRGEGRDQDRGRGRLVDGQGAGADDGRDQDGDRDHERDLPYADAEQPDREVAQPDAEGDPDHQLQGPAPAPAGGAAQHDHRGDRGEERTAVPQHVGGEVPGDAGPDARLDGDHRLEPEPPAGALHRPREPGRPLGLTRRGLPTRLDGLGSRRHGHGSR
jgi:hypothetical protein